MLPPEDVYSLRKHFTAGEEAQYQQVMNGYTVGTPECCKTEIKAVAAALGTTEIAVVTVTHDFSAREEGYRLLMR